MKIIPIKISLLSHFFNYSRLTNQGAITSDFIGDIALNYALNRVLKLENFYTEFRTKPKYEELANLPYTFTVAKPENYELTPIYIRNTLFNVDGYPDLQAIDLSGKSPFKNFFKVQGIQVGSEFSTFLICKKEFDVTFPLVIRLGTGRETLALLERQMKNNSEQVWLNVFSLKNIYKNFESSVKLIKNYQFEFRLQNYILWKSVKVEHLENVFGDHFHD